MSVKPFIVIGGGAAGLSAAIQLAQSNKRVLLLEKGVFAPPRMCGEFLSPECLPILNDWEIKPATQISAIGFQHSNGKHLQMQLPRIAGALPRTQLESALLKRAQQVGVELHDKTSVLSISRQNPSEIILKLSQQQPIRAAKVIVSAGRYYQQAKKPRFIYKGLKAHFRGNHIPSCLEMVMVPNTYFGVIPVGQGLINVALLSRINHPIPPEFTDYLSRFEQVDEWIEGVVPEFGFKPCLNIPQVYTIGDAAASIPPITGNGVGMAVTSGVSAAKAALRGDWLTFKKESRQQLSRRMAWGKRLHRIALSPTLSSLMMSVAQRFPHLSDFFYTRTRGNISP